MSRTGGLLRTYQQSEVSLQRKMPVESSSTTLTTVATETLQFKYFSSGVLTDDAGEPVGTLIVGKLANTNIKGALGDVVGTISDTSLSLALGTTLVNLVAFDQIAAEGAERSGQTLEEKAQAVTAGFGDGDYTIDHRTGTIYALKGDTGTDDTVSYLADAAATGGGGGGDASAANQTTQIGLETTIRDNTNTPSTVASGQKTIAVAGTDEALAATTTIKSIVVTALPTNTDNVFLGASGVSSATGLILQPGAGAALEIDDPAKVYADVAVSGEGVSFITLA